MVIQRATIAGEFDDLGDRRYREAACEFCRGPDPGQGYQSSDRKRLCLRVERPIREVAIVAGQEMSDQRDRRIKQGKRDLGIGGQMVMSAQDSRDRSPFRMRGEELNPCLLRDQAVSRREASAISDAARAASSKSPRSANSHGTLMAIIAVWHEFRFPRPQRASRHPRRRHPDSELSFRSWYAQAESERRADCRFVCR